MSNNQNNKKEEAGENDEKVLKFKIGCATVYSRLYKQLFTKANAITPYGMDIAAMLQNGIDVDFNPDRPTKLSMKMTRHEGSNGGTGQYGVSGQGKGMGGKTVALQAKPKCNVWSFNEEV
jgi:hypothetical protein